VLYEQGSEGIRQWTEDVNDSGYAARQAADRLDNLEGDVGKLSAALDRDLIKSGSAANDVLRELVQEVTALADWYGNLPEGAQAAALAIGVGTAAVLLFSGTIFLAIPRVAAFKVALEELKLTMRGTALAGGAIGLALTGVVAILGILASKQADAAASTLAYADSLDTVTGATTAYTRELTKAKLASKGDWLQWLAYGNTRSTFDTATKLGLSLDTVTDAALGNTAALEELHSVTAPLMNDTSELGQAARQLERDIRNNSTSLDEAIDITKQKAQADSDAISQNGQLADSYNDVSDEVDGVVTSLKDLAKEIDAANNVQLDAREAARALEAAYDDFDETIKKNGKSLNIHTEKGRENQAALDGMARAALNSGDAIIAAGGTYDDYRSSLESSRKAILDRIHDLGLSGQKAEDLADKILKIPSKTEFEVLANVAPAEEALKGLIDGYSGKTIYLNAKTQYAYNSGSVGGIPQVKKADGGIVKFFANGGVEHHAAQIVRAGTTRVWAEPETGGEAYIPLGMPKRAQATPVLAQVADEFGYQLVPKDAQSFADGGTTGKASKSTARPQRIEGELRLVDGRAYISGVISDELNGSF
jgi:hypothetical protein